MKQIKLRCTGANNFNPNISVNGEMVRTKRNKFGTVEGIYFTDKEEAEIQVYKLLELDSKFWLLWAMIYFVVSVFGIFDIKYDKRCLRVKCKFKVKLKEQNEVLLKFSNLKDNVEIVSDNEMEIEENSCFVDQNARKRLKIIKWIKVFVWVCVVAIVCIIVFDKFKGE